MEWLLRARKSTQCPLEVTPLMVPADPSSQTKMLHIDTPSNPCISHSPSFLPFPQSWEEESIIYLQLWTHWKADGLSPKDAQKGYVYPELTTTTTRPCACSHDLPNLRTSVLIRKHGGEKKYIRKELQVVFFWSPQEKREIGCIWMHWSCQKNRHLFCYRFTIACNWILVIIVVILTAALTKKFLTSLVKIGFGT